MIESGSSLGVMMDCPRKYFYQYERMLEQPGYSAALTLGSFVHAAVEEFTGGRQDAMLATRGEYMKRIDEQYHQKIIDDMKLARGIADIWRARWEKDHPFGNTKLEFLKSEMEWGINVISPGETNWVHVGKSDGVVRHKEYDKVFLYELKTAADRDRDTYVHRLEIDKQVSSNILALKGMGYDCAGVIYDVIWKPGLRLKKEETQEELNARMLSAMGQDDNYFERFIVYRNDRALDEHMHDLNGQFNHLDRLRSSGNFYRNSGACDKYGRLCPYISLCMEGHEELEQVFKRRDRKLPELSTAIQKE